MSKELINFDTFNADFGMVLAENEMFKDNTKHGKKCITELKDRLIEHVSLKYENSLQSKIIPFNNFHRIFE